MQNPNQFSVVLCKIIHLLQKFEFLVSRIFFFVKDETTNITKFSQKSETKILAANLLSSTLVYWTKSKREMFQRGTDKMFNCVAFFFLLTIFSG